MLIPTGYAQVNAFLATNTFPRVGQVTYGISLLDWIGTVAEAAEACYDLFAEHPLSMLTSNTTLTKVRVKKGPNLDGPYAEFGGTETGSQTGESCTPQVSFLIRKNTDKGGRQGAGRMFLGPPQDAAISPNGTVIGSGSSVVTGAFEDWLEAHTTADLPLVLLHGVGTSDTSPEIIRSFSCEALVATQRRRLRG